MGKAKKKLLNHKVLVAEFRVSMHCNACETSVAKAISKIKGVQTFMTDMPRNRVVVKGRINCEKVVKKLRKKAGKRAEILSVEEEVDDGSSDKSDKEKGDISVQEASMDVLQTEQPCWMVDTCWDSEVYAMFSDENPNACSTM